MLSIGESYEKKYIYSLVILIIFVSACGVNESQLTSNLEVDTIKPKIEFKVYFPTIIIKGEMIPVYFSYVTVVDNVDSMSAVNDVKITHNIDMNTCGTYEINVEATDYSGNSTEVTENIYVLSEFTKDYIDFFVSYGEIEYSDIPGLEGEKILCLKTSMARVRELLSSDYMIDSK
ncbi:hypothetical protein KHQ82_01125 [Mycoplasmatota bacterium]|nr:hypothetical protein KHQ82_01125 [Mycoplasmatota bacterium]